MSDFDLSKYNPHAAYPQGDGPRVWRVPEPARSVSGPVLGGNLLLGFEHKAPGSPIGVAALDVETLLVVSTTEHVQPLGIHMSAPEGVTITVARIGDVPLIRGPVLASVWNACLNPAYGNGGGVPAVRLTDCPVLSPAVGLEVGLRWKRRPGIAWSGDVTGYILCDRTVTFARHLANP